MKNIYSFIAIMFIALLLTACGSKVEIPPAHVGKLMTKDGYTDGIRGTSKFRLAPCLAYCDKIVLLDVSDQANTEDLEIFIPEDKLKLKVSIRTNLTITPTAAEGLFNSLPPNGNIDSTVALIERENVYKTYAQQIILTETREYLSQFSIAQIASSLEKVNLDLRERLSKSLQERTPFTVRYVGITDIKYPDIIVDAQENAAKRREQIQQEEAQLEISKVSLERELQEAQLQRKIDLEKALADAEADRVRASAVTPSILRLRELENERTSIAKWDGKMPETVVTNDSSVLLKMGGSSK